MQPYNSGIFGNIRATKNPTITYKRRKKKDSADILKSIISSSLIPANSTSNNYARHGHATREKKKRNVVSQLRTAKGEPKDMEIQNDFSPMGSDNEDNIDLDDHSTFSPSANRSSNAMVASPLLSPTTTLQAYRDRMEELLAELIQQRDTPPPLPSALRPPYVPENTIHSPITYSRKIPKESIRQPTEDELYLEIFMKYTLGTDYYP